MQYLCTFELYANLQYSCTFIHFLFCNYCCISISCWRVSLFLSVFALWFIIISSCWVKKMASFAWTGLNCKPVDFDRFTVLGWFCQFVWGSCHFGSVARVSVFRIAATWLLVGPVVWNRPVVLNHVNS